MPKMIALLIVCLGLFLPHEATAHPLNNGYSDVRMENKQIFYDLTLPENSFQQQSSNFIEPYIRRHLVLTNHGIRLEMKLISFEKAANSEVPSVVYHLSFTSASTIDDIQIEYSLFFDDRDPQHLNFLLIHHEDDVDQTVFETAERTFHYVPYHTTGLLSTAWSYLLLGIKHILSGYDHLLFLISLLIIAQKVKEIVVIVTAFTVAHSVTLLLAATGHLTIASLWIESAIALTICYTAAENIFLQNKKSANRALLAFLFGLVHGMGFAGALSAIGLSPKYMLGSLLSFNIGVELGQFGVVLLVLPLVLKLRNKKWYPTVVVSVSSIIFLIAFVWLLQRVGIIRS